MADHLQLVHDARFTVERYEDIQPREGGYLVKGLLPDRGLAFIAGPARAGKSFVALDWALSIGSGPGEEIEVLGRRTHHGSVVYVGAEDTAGLRLRVAAWRLHHDIEHVAFDLIPHAPNMREREDIEQLYDLIVEVARDRQALGDPLLAVFFDTLSQIIPGADENGSVDMSPVIRSLNVLGRRLDCLIVVVAHTGKDELKGVRGWSGLEANADAIIRIDRDPESPEARAITLDKIKNGVDGATIGFSLQTVQLGEDSDGDPWESCVPVYSGARSRKPRTRTGTNARHNLIVRAMHQCIDRGLTVFAPAQPGVRNGTAAVERNILKDALRSMGYTDDDENFHAVKVRINRDLQALIAAGRIRGSERMVWFPYEEASDTL